MSWWVKSQHPPHPWHCPPGTPCYYTSPAAAAPAFHFPAYSHTRSPSLRVSRQVAGHHEHWVTLAGTHNTGLITGTHTGHYWHLGPYTGRREDGRASAHEGRARVHRGAAPTHLLATTRLCPPPPGMRSSLGQVGPKVYGTATSPAPPSLFIGLLQVGHTYTSRQDARIKRGKEW